MTLFLLRNTSNETRNAKPPKKTDKYRTLRLRQQKIKIKTAVVTRVLYLSTKAMGKKPAQPEETTDETNHASYESPKKEPADRGDRLLQKYGTYLVAEHVVEHAEVHAPL